MRGFLKIRRALKPLSFFRPPCFLFQPFGRLLSKLLCFLVQGVLAAETAVLVKFESVGIIFLILHSVIVALFAFAACKSDLYSH